MQEDLLDLIDFLQETDESETTMVAGYVIDDGIRYHVELRYDLEDDELGVKLTVDGMHCGTAKDTGDIIEIMDYYISTYGDYVQ